MASVECFSHSARVSSHSRTRFTSDSNARTGFLLFARLLTGTVTSPEAGVKLVADALYPAKWLDRPDPDHPERTKRQSVEEVRNGPHDHPHMCLAGGRTFCGASTSLDDSRSAVASDSSMPPCASR
jgi:hypothetical protein